MRLSLLLILLSSQWIHANHIRGGEITYHNISNGVFEIETKMYIDCDCISCAVYEDVIELAVYQDQALINTVYVQLESINGLSNLQKPCAISNLPCVQVAVYRTTLTLAQSVTPYTIVYQRCCRVEGINNIVTPEENGITIAVDITPEAWVLGNSSPTFNSLPPANFCLFNDYTIDLSVTDLDDDSLVYYLCSPLNGAGTNGDTAGCIGIEPSPPCAGPFLSLDFVAGFTFDNPFSTAIASNLNVETGSFQIIAGTLGSYQTAVCVNEYRNDTLLSTIRRDFNILTNNCMEFISGSMANDSIDYVTDTYFVSDCSDSLVHIENQSVVNDNIESYSWQFDINGTTVYFNGSGTQLDNWNPVVQLPAFGYYSGLLVLEGVQGCIDTTNIVIHAIPGVTNDFTFAFDSCNYSPVEFVSQSSSISPITNEIWSFGASGSEVSNYFNTAGTQNVWLISIDSSLCRDTAYHSFELNQVPAFLSYEIEQTQFCLNDPFLFENLTYPISNEYEVLWVFGDGQTSNAISPIHTFQDPGDYIISLSVTSPTGCERDTVFETHFVLAPSIVADFYCTPDTAYLLTPDFACYDQSIDALTWHWDVQYQDFSTPDIEVGFQDTGNHTISLIVTDENGCVDTMSVDVFVTLSATFFLPTAFSPNGDQKNDFFLGKGYTYDIKSFNLEVYDRFGELVFSTTDYNEGWNGRHKNEGALADTGAYVYKLTYTTSSSTKYKHGQLMLVR
jgi:gliding motility-associated-like protein